MPHDKHPESEQAEFDYCAYIESLGEDARNPSKRIDQVMHEEKHRFVHRLTVNPTCTVLPCDSSHADRLTREHNRPEHYKADKIVLAILQAAGLSLTMNACDKDAKPLQDLRQILKIKGAFLDQYPDSVYRERLSEPKPDSPECMIMSIEATDPVDDQRKVCGTYEIIIPHEGSSNPVVHIPNPERHDSHIQYLDKDLARRLSGTHPSRIALTPDITVLPHMADKGIAGEGRDAAFKVLQRKNQERNSHPIEYVVSEVFSIRGIRTPDKREIILEHIDKTGPLDNGRGIFIQLFPDGRNPARRGWTRSEDVPVNIDGQTFILLVDWFVCVNIIQNQTSDSSTDAPTTEAPSEPETQPEGRENG